MAKRLTFDSIQVEIKGNGKALDTIQFNREKKDTYARVFQQVDNLDAGILNPYRPYKMNFNFPIEGIDLKKIKLTEDSIPKTNFTVTKDSTDVLSYNFNYLWKKKANYVISLEEGAIIAIFDTKNKPIRKAFRLGSADDYGSFALKVQVPDTTKSYVLEVLNDKKIVVSSEVITKNKAINYTNYKVGSYFTRVIYDENKNGIWDTGNVKQGFQPEKIWYAPLELSIKANWDRKEKLIIPKE